MSLIAHNYDVVIHSGRSMRAVTHPHFYMETHRPPTDLSFSEALTPNLTCLVTRIDYITYDIHIHDMLPTVCRPKIVELVSKW